MLSDNSTVGEARQSQTFGILDQASLVDKVLFVDSTYVFKEKGNQFEVSFVDRLVIENSTHKRRGVFNVVQRIVSVGTVKGNSITSHIVGLEELVVVTLALENSGKNRLAELGNHFFLLFDLK